VTSLQELFEVFINPLRESAKSKKPILPEEKLRPIFPHLDVILSYNQQLLQELKKKKK